MSKNTTDRFDQNPDQPYGRGEDGEIFQTEEEANEYMQHTLEEARKAPGANLLKGIRGKKVTVTNRSRKDRIRSAVHDSLDMHGPEDGTEDVVQWVYDGDLTEEEARAAIKRWDPEPMTAFGEWMDELNG